jgi:hypothetical protein
MSAFPATGISEPRRVAANGRAHLLVIALLGASVLLFWVPRQLALHESRRVLVRTRLESGTLERRLEEATAGLEAARGELRQREQQREQARLGVIQLEQAIAKVHPECRWAAPPLVLPDWTPESPYVWVRKELLPLLPIQPFTDDGRFKKEVADVLMLGDTGPLEQMLQRTLAEYHQMEVANAEPKAEPLPGFDKEKSVTFHIKPPLGDRGVQLRDQFETAIRSHLGSQRADLLLQAAEGWLNTQFGALTSESKTISVTGEASGRYSIGVRSGGGGWLSVGGVSNLSEYIPKHLLPLFVKGDEPLSARR